MKTTVPQVFEEVEKAKTLEEKVRVLKAYESKPLRALLRLNFDPNVGMQLPEGAPPYKIDKSLQDGQSETNLYVEYRRFYIWLDPKVNLPRARKEQLFIQMLEGIHWKEAEDLILSKDRKLHTKYKSLHPKIVQVAFPGLIPPNVTELPKVKKEPKKAKDPSEESLPE